MAQYRATEWQNAIDSFPLNRSRAAINPPGRYRGFDAIKSLAGNPETPGNVLMALYHYINPFYPVLDDNTPGAAHGVVISPQGTILMGDDEYNFEIQNNMDGQGRVRYDLVYLEYTWLEVQDGAPFTIQILEGVPGSGVPSVPDPNIHVSLGNIMVPSPTQRGTDLFYFSDLVFEYDAIPKYSNVSVLLSNPELYDEFMAKAGGAFEGSIMVPSQFFLFGNLITQISSADTVANNKIYLDDSSMYFEIALGGTKVIKGFLNNLDEPPVGTIYFLKFSDVGSSYLYCPDYSQDAPNDGFINLTGSLQHLYLEENSVVSVIKVKHESGDNRWQILSYMGPQNLGTSWSNLSLTNGYTSYYADAAVSCNPNTGKVELRGNISKTSPATPGIYTTYNVAQISNPNHFPTTTKVFPTMIGNSQMGLVLILSNGTIQVGVKGGDTLDMVTLDGLSYYIRD